MKEETLISITELSELLGVNPVTIRGWNGSKSLSKAKEGSKYNLKLVLKYIYESSKQIEEELGERSSSASESKKYWDSKKSEIQVKEMLSELIPKKEYIETEKERFLIVKEQVLNIPNKLSSDLALTLPQKQLVESTCLYIIENIKDTFKDRAKIWNEFINAPLLTLQKEMEEETKEGV